MIQQYTSLGVVKSHQETSDKKKYSEILVKTPENFNYRMFIPGADRPVGSKIKITIKDLK